MGAEQRLRQAWGSQFSDKRRQRRLRFCHDAYAFRQTKNGSLDPMKIHNAGRGIHAREIKGIERLQTALPRDWYAFTNLDLVLDAGKAREIDVIVVTPLRIFLVDLKDWHGSISSVDGRWYLNGRERDLSPVAKVTDIARRLAPLLNQHLKKRQETRTLPVPRIEGLVVLTGNADRKGIAEIERAKVLTADEFIKILKDNRLERETFGNIAGEFLSRNLTDQFWRGHLVGFFNAGPSSVFKPGKRRFQRFTADEVQSFAHPEGVYVEYDAVDESNKNNLGTLRLWDFGKCDTKFQNEEGRLEIAGREQEVYHWLRDRNEEVDRTLLTPKIDDPERSVHYWEVYDRRRRMQRLSLFSVTEARRILPVERLDLARQMLSALTGLHRHDAAHLDLGGHSIWVEQPTTIKFSHLLAARFPEVKTLGTARYQFLASVDLPDDLLGVDSSPKRRDVFLIATAIHQLLFGSIPKGSPPEWNADVDATREFEALHGWFAQALDMDANQRFADAVVALEAFNRATAARPTFDEVMAGLERFRRADVRSQRQLFALYPQVGVPLVETDRLEAWRSGEGDGTVLVKLWKQSAWGDLKREGAAVLSFLNRAADMKADHPEGLPVIKDAYWLGDAFALVQGWVEGVTLAHMLDGEQPGRAMGLDALQLVRRIATTVDGVHELGFGHGDLKPANIVIGADGSPVLIDALDFSPRSDGERRSSAYAPETGSVFERDRYAVTRIVEEVLARAEIDLSEAAMIGAAIQVCREREPRLSTLLPLLDAFEAAVRRLTAPPDAAPTETQSTISISIKGAETGPLEADEGSLFLRLRDNADGATRSLFIRGAVEEIEVRLGKMGEPLSARRSSMEQGRIRRIAQYEFHHIKSSLDVVRSDQNDLDGLLPLLADPAIQARFRNGQVAPSAAAESEDVVPERVSEEEAEERLAEEEVAATPAGSSVDVPLLWRSLMDAENELTTEGFAQADSWYDRSSRTHRVHIELESGDFDFARNDTVGVERQGHKGQWRRIGELDIQLSRPDRAVIHASDLGGTLVEEGQRLRFSSHFEVQSLRRRTDAVDRILSGSGRARDLLSVFDARRATVPEAAAHNLDRELLALYALNGYQEEAFERLVGCRPVGLLQGPPGTGKTRFIAALAHYAITKGLARNVLLASQSHEAVNTAAEAVLTLFRSRGEPPSLLRVAMDEALVSPPLRPFHSVKVETSMKDKFRASFRERLGAIGGALGLPGDVVADVIALEENVRPIAARLRELTTGDDPNAQQIDGLVSTMQSHLDTIGLERVVARDVAEWQGFVEIAAARIAAKHAELNDIGVERTTKLLDAAKVGRDFAGSVSRAQRSFESFLAGTRQIVAGTCVGLGRASLGLTSTAFDLVIVDEAARCTASELLVPLQAARWVVLVGDHAQLEPHHKPEVIEEVWERTQIPKREIRRSDFERVFSTVYGRSAGARLRTQYRMLPPIGALVSEAFYPDLPLAAGRTVPEIEAEALPPSLDCPLIWVTTDSLGEAGYERREDGGSSRINRAEASAIVAMLEEWHGHEGFRNWLQTQQKHPAGIGIICMYAAQRDLIRQRLRQSPLAYLLDAHVKVGTVDSYQGKENPIVILSLVRNNEDGYLEGGVRCIGEGFLRAANRINVAASRAMDRLVVVGARRRWATGGAMRRLADAFTRQESAGQARAVEAQVLLEREAGNAGGKRGGKREYMGVAGTEGGRNG